MRAAWKNSVRHVCVVMTNINKVAQCDSYRIAKDLLGKSDYRLPSTALVLTNKLRSLMTTACDLQLGSQAQNRMLRLCAQYMIALTPLYKPSIVSKHHLLFFTTCPKWNSPCILTLPQSFTAVSTVTRSHECLMQPANFEAGCFSD